MTAPVNADRVFHREIGRDYPMVDRGEGIYVFDSTGRRYIDGAGGVFVVNIGHGSPAVEQAIAAQVQRIAFAHTGNFTSEAEQRFSARLLALAPPGFTKVWMSTSGSAANETALKLARHYHLLAGHPEKTKVISRWNSYHGSSLGALSMTGQTRRREPYEPYLLNFPHIEPPYCYRCPFGKTPDSCSIDCAEELERTIRRIGAQYVSAFIVEPVSGGPLGALAAPDGYFARIREICDRHDVLLIVDEVVTGVGRTGRNMGIDHWGVVPDLITLAKGIGGGYVPIGATLVHERVYAAFETSGTSFRHGETFAGHTLTAAIGSAVLDEIERLDLVARAAEMGELLATQLETLRVLPMVGDVRGKGLLRGIELVRDKATKTPFARDRHVSEQVAEEAMARGLLVIAGTGCVDGADGDTIALAPPYIVEAAEIQAIADILRSAITTVAARELAD